MKCSLSVFLLPDFRVTLTANNEKIKQAVPLDWLITSKEDVNGKEKALPVALVNQICVVTNRKQQFNKMKRFSLKKKRFLYIHPDKLSPDIESVVHELQR